MTDAPCAAELLTLGVRVETTPRDFAPQKARFKARSLDYLRFALQLQPQDWVLHLDEESTVDEHALIACIDFIKHGEYEFGQVNSQISHFCPPHSLSVIAETCIGHYFIQRSQLLATSLSHRYGRHSCC